MSKKPKPATDGERLELRWLRRVNGPVSLSEFRRLDDFVNERVAAKAHDRAIARAIARTVKKERERCSFWARTNLRQSDIVLRIMKGTNP